MPNENETKSTNAMDIVKEMNFPTYNYQKPEYGFGSIGGKQNQEKTKEPKKIKLK
jgi:hypothetical protein